MNNSTVETLIGTAVVAIAAGFFLFAYNTSGQGSTTNGYSLSAEFDNAEGINVGTDVRMAGVKVGTVTGFALNAENYTAHVTLALDNALKQYHASGDAGAAADTFGRLQQRLSSGTVPMLGREQAMVSRLAASAHRLQSGGGAIAGDIDQLGIVGQWSIVSQKGLRDLAPGDIVEITPARELVTIRQSGEQAGTRIAQTFQVSANELHIDNTSLVFAYSLDGTKLKLATPGNERNLRLKRIGS